MVAKAARENRTLLSDLQDQCIAIYAWAALSVSHSNHFKKTPNISFNIVAILFIRPNIFYYISHNMIPFSVSLYNQGCMDHPRNRGNQVYLLLSLLSLLSLLPQYAPKRLCRIYSTTSLTGSSSCAHSSAIRVAASII